MKTINIQTILETNIAISSAQGTLLTNYVQQFYKEYTVVRLDFSQINATSTAFLKNVFEPLNQKHLKYQVLTNENQTHLKQKIKLIKHNQFKRLSRVEQHRLMFDVL